MEITNDDVCAYNLGFVRAMFDMAKSAAGHAGKGAEWNNLAESFRNQITEIDALSTELTIFVPNVHFQNPKANSAHKKVPSPSDVGANPGEYSAAN
uniref:Uncharacterized protein n=1 Tax=Globodera rostochiensis TaxID=31243 RepID=A0A914HY66_GLORO